MPLLAMLSTPAPHALRSTLLTPGEVHALLVSGDRELFRAFPTLDSDNPQISWEELAEFRREQQANAYAYRHAQGDLNGCSG